MRAPASRSSAPSLNPRADHVHDARDGEGRCDAKRAERSTRSRACPAEIDQFSSCAAEEHRWKQEQAHRYRRIPPSRWRRFKYAQSDQRIPGQTDDDRDDFTFREGNFVNTRQWAWRQQGRRRRQYHDRTNLGFHRSSSRKVLASSVDPPMLAYFILGALVVGVNLAGMH